MGHRKDGSDMADEPEYEAAELEFPLQFPNCAVCGCPDTIAQTIANGIIKKGQASENLKAWLTLSKNLIVDQTRPWLSAPLLATMECACAQCGRRTVYYAAA